DRPLEHEVLEQVREARAPLRLGAEPDVVVHGHDHHRRPAVGGDHHPQAVVEPEALDGKGHPGPRRCHAGWHRRHDTRAWGPGRARVAEAGAEVARGLGVLAATDGQYREEPAPGPGLVVEVTEARAWSARS